MEADCSVLDMKTRRVSTKPKIYPPHAKSDLKPWCAGVGWCERPSFKQSAARTPPRPLGVPTLMQKDSQSVSFVAVPPRSLDTTPPSQRTAERLRSPRSASVINSVNTQEVLSTRSLRGHAMIAIIRCRKGCIRAFTFSIHTVMHAQMTPYTGQKPHAYTSD